MKDLNGKGIVWVSETEDGEGSTGEYPLKFGKNKHTRFGYYYAHGECPAGTQDGTEGAKKCWDRVYWGRKANNGSKITSGFSSRYHGVLMFGDDDLGEKFMDDYDIKFKGFETNNGITIGDTVYVSCVGGEGLKHLSGTNSAEGGQQVSGDEKNKEWCKNFDGENSIQDRELGSATNRYVWKKKSGSNNKWTVGGSRRDNKEALRGLLGQTAINHKQGNRGGHFCLLDWGANEKPKLKALFWYEGIGWVCLGNANQQKWGDIKTREQLSEVDGEDVVFDDFYRWTRGGKTIRWDKCLRLCCSRKKTTNNQGEYKQIKFKRPSDNSNLDEIEFCITTPKKLTKVKKLIF